jgi:hypothetical protein
MYIIRFNRSHDRDICWLISVGRFQGKIKWCWKLSAVVVTNDTAVVSLSCQKTMNTIDTMTLKSNMLSITSLSPSFVLQISVFSLSTVRLQSILDPSSSDLISNSVQDFRSVSSSIDTYATTPNGYNEQVTSQIQSPFCENFIIISASVAGVIIIVFGSLMVLYLLNKLPGQQRHKSNELHRDKPDNIDWRSFSP